MVREHRLRRAGGRRCGPGSATSSDPGRSSPIRSPRSRRRRAGRQRRRAPSPANRTEPVDSAPGPRSPKNASIVTLLPEPDSPTTATRLARGDVEVDTAHGTRRPAGPCERDVQVAHSQDRAISSSASVIDRVLHIARALTSKVSRSASPTKLKASTTQQDGETGPQRDPPLVEVPRPVVDHRAPLRRRRRGAEADEAQRGGEQHDLAEVHRRVDHHRRDTTTAARTGAGSAIAGTPIGGRGLDVLAVA